MSESTPSRDLARVPIKDLKSAAREAFRNNLVTCAVVGLLTATLIWPTFNPSTLMASTYDLISELSTHTQLPIDLNQVREVIANLQHWTSVGSDASAGVIYSIYDSAQAAGGLEKALFEAISHAVFQGSLSASVIAVLALITTLAVTMFLRLPLRISSLRVYLEARLYPDTPISRLLFVFKRHRALGIGLAGLYKYGLLLLWAPTIVMLPVKYYSYLMYDYILAENPDASPRQALKLSQEMMKGKRRRAFLLDLSFLGWYLLGLISFGLVIFFYASPYHNSTVAGLYVRLREERFRTGQDVTIFNDPYLVSPATDDTLLGDGFVIDEEDLTAYPTPPTARSLDRWTYQRTYSWTNLVLLFFCFSFIGWAYESLLSFAYVGHFVNRGTLYGPWLPIYGVGAVGALVILKPLRHRLVLTFFAAMVLSGIIEYISGTVVLAVTGMEYWDYHGYFFNIQGRVCLEGLLVFGLGCTAVIYFLAPLLDTLLDRIPLTVRRTVIAVLAAAFLADFIFTLANPRSGIGLTS